MALRDLEDGAQLDLVLLVREADRRQRKDGEDGLRLVLGDRTGKVTAMVWDAIDEVAERAVPGTPVRVIGRFEVHPRYGPQINLKALRRPEEGSYDPAGLVDGPPVPIAELEARLRALVAATADPPLRALLEHLFDAAEPLWRRFVRASAAKTYHQAYPGGLLEHSVTVAEAVDRAAAIFPGIDRDVAVAGALVHDLGKVDAYTQGGPSIEMTDAGRLQGHIVLGYLRVRRAMGRVERDLGAGFPGTTAQHVLHIVLSHHGALEHGSPVAPQTREAVLVHQADDLGARLGSFDRLQKGLAPDATWSAYDRAIGGGAFFGPTRGDAPLEPGGRTVPGTARTPVGPAVPPSAPTERAAERSRPGVGSPAPQAAPVAAAPAPSRAAAVQGPLTAGPAAPPVPAGRTTTPAVERSDAPPTPDPDPGRGRAVPPEPPWHADPAPARGPEVDAAPVAPAPGYEEARALDWFGGRAA